MVSPPGGPGIAGVSLRVTPCPGDRAVPGLFRDGGGTDAGPRISTGNALESATKLVFNFGGKSSQQEKGWGVGSIGMSEGFFFFRFWMRNASPGRAQTFRGPILILGGRSRGYKTCSQPEWPAAGCVRRGPSPPLPSTAGWGLGQGRSPHSNLLILRFCLSTTNNPVRHHGWTPV